jgi:hypothetical protein
MKNILLCTDGSAFAENVYKYGAWFANQFHARINVLFVTDIRSQQVVSTGNFSGSLGLGASEELLMTRTVAPGPIPAESVKGIKNKV